MRLLFCSDPLNRRKPDSVYERDAAAADRLGIEYSLIDFEALVYEQNPDKAVRNVTPALPQEIGIYRGWMMPPVHYGALCAALADRRITLVNTEPEYRHCHYLPDSYASIVEHTPKSVWISADEDLGISRLMELVRPFGVHPIILKDYVKSRKHEWLDACYIPSASDKDALERVVRRFLTLQDGELNGGLVFREFVEFEPLTTHSKSGMPLTKEFRIFFLNGEPIHTTQYWSEGDYQGITPPLDKFRVIASEIDSRFFTMDVAKRKDGNWMIVELGDAQVAELSDHSDPDVFYAALNQRLSLIDDLLGD